MTINKAHQLLSDDAFFSKAMVKNFNKIAVNTLQDLLLHCPLRYIDETRIVNIRDVRLGESLQVQGEVVHAEVSYKPRKALIVRIADVSGQLTLRFLHFYPSQINALKEGKKVRVYGEVRSGFFGYEMVHPQFSATKEGVPLKEELTPVYPTTAGLTQPGIRKAIAYALKQDILNETVPEQVYQSLGLPSFASSIHALHYPTPDMAISSLEDRSSHFWQRLAFDELLAQQLSMRKHYERRRRLNAPAIPVSKTLCQQFETQLSFELTGAQQKVIKEISQDLTQPHPMQRLLQGDVGSGKTVVGAMAALQAIEAGWQVALMAPTEILAEQHFKKLLGWLAPLGLQVTWLTGSQTKKERTVSLAVIESGEAHFVVGTHALFQEAVVFKKLGLAIIDEQHRFGVQQRLALRRKGHPEPHQLMMTATPIPRTLSMSYYADLDVSVIDELPAGRTPIATKLVSNQRRDEILDRIHAACMEGRQAYWVCPLIEESETLQLETAMDSFAYMEERFPDLKIGLVHGRMKPAEKQEVMRAFSQGETQLLVATTVIEVGVDVPNASLMIIEHAERMGLSQLHQLRGRVGRGAVKSLCILLYESKLSEIASARLKVIHENTDGFIIAQEDLNIRGPGEYLGTRQSGVPMLKIADLTLHATLLGQAKTVAADLLKTQPQVVEQHLARWMPNSNELVKV